MRSPCTNRIREVVAYHETTEDMRIAVDNGRLQSILEPLGVDLLGAFGSATHPDATREPNDLDLGARFTGKPFIVELIDALTQLTGYDRIDVAIVTGNHPVIDAEALCGIPLYEREPGGFAEAQIAALAHKRDTAFLRELDLNGLAS